MCPLFGAARDHSSHDISGLEALHALVLLWACTREAEAIHPAHLSRAMPRRSDRERHHPLDKEAFGCARPDRGGIQPVRLGKVTGDAIVFRPAATTTLNGQPERFEPLIQHPTGCVDRCCVSEWG